VQPEEYEVEFKNKAGAYTSLVAHTVAGKCMGKYDVAPSNPLNADYKCNLTFA